MASKSTCQTAWESKIGKTSEINMYTDKEPETYSGKIFMIRQW